MLHCRGCNKEVFPEIETIEIAFKSGGVAIIEVRTRYRCDCGYILYLKHPRTIEVQ